MFILKNVTKIYGDVNTESSVVALKNINLQIKQGEFLSVVGKSGSGKSTLINLIGALDVPTSGEVIFEDKNLSELKADERADFRNKNTGFVFQSFYLEPEYTVLKNVCMPLIIAGKGKVERESAAVKVLEQVGLASKINKKARELSGGEMQRVSIARALVHEPKIILADEPTGNLDSENGAKIITLLRSIAQSGRTVILITHNEADARTADRLIRLSDGEIVEDGFCEI